MVLDILRWLGKNLTTLLLAFMMAMVVWISAVIADDPNQEQNLGRAINIEMTGQDINLLLMGEPTNQVRVRLNAPRSLWSRLNSDTRAIRAWVNLAGLGPGEHTVPVEVDPAIRPVRIVDIDPPTITVSLEPLITRTVTTTLVIEGEPASGYEAGTPVYTPTQVTISGASSLVSQVTEVSTQIDISGASQSIDTSVALRPRDVHGNMVGDVEVLPEYLQVQQPVTLLGGYRNVIVRVSTQGQVVDGYRLTTITVSPPSVIVFSSDPRLVNELPGYVDADPIDLTGVRDDLEMYVNLQLPDNISVVEGQSVLVQIGVAVIESQITVPRPIEVVGLAPGLQATLIPNTVDLVLSGPIPVLDSMRVSNLRVVIDLAGRGVGAYEIEPELTSLPERVQLLSLSPAVIDVLVTRLPTATPTPTLDLTPLLTPNLTPGP